MIYYLLTWAAAGVYLAYEYISLNFFPQYSSLKHFFPWATTEPGRPLSLFMGWSGITVMVLMNLYSLRKRYAVFQTFGRISAWLEFHIFCGLLGPLFILFHSDFKVRGLVAISFWSMIISASSGIVGRYFYIQLLKKRKEIDSEIAQWSATLKKMQEDCEYEVSDELLERVKHYALVFVGVSPAIVQGGALQMSDLGALFSSIRGDIRLAFGLPKTIKGFPPTSRLVLRNYALATRQRLFLDPFQHLMGYWHTFHKPFAIFMYVAAAIHILTALIFGVNK